MNAAADQTLIRTKRTIPLLREIKPASTELIEASKPSTLAVGDQARHLFAAPNYPHTQVILLRRGLGAPHVSSVEFDFSPEMNRRAGRAAAATGEALRASAQWMVLVLRPM
ncbi:MAG TPA: hypothetical protein VE998_06125 [Terriglobales bacterium]|nr:hypothetical protein [Terriglobales bacterium]